MRAGPFSETRVIELINCRFVPFYFNTGGPGAGHDEAAAAFVDGKTPNPWAFLAAFDPDGEPVGITSVYADKDEVFHFLRGLLDEHPGFDTATAAETEIVQRAEAESAALPAVVAAGRLFERLGLRQRAIEAYRRAATATDGNAIEALRGLLRLTRDERQWADHERWLRELTRRAEEPVAVAAGVAADIALERGIRWSAAQRWTEAKAELERAAHAFPGSPLFSELHFRAGVACWFAGDRDRAKLHWGIIVRQLPDDRLYMRSYLTAAAEEMPYANYELGNYKAPVGNIGTQNIVVGVEHALRICDRLLPQWRAEAVPPAAPDAGAMPDSGELARLAPPRAFEGSIETLVCRLRDTQDAAANERVGEAVVAWIKASSQDGWSTAPLLTACINPKFRGRRAALRTVASVRAALPQLTAQLTPALDDCAKDANPEIRKLAAEALAAGQKAPASDRHGEPAGDGQTPMLVPTPADGNGVPETTNLDGVEQETSAFRLVARFVDSMANTRRNNVLMERLKKMGAPAVAALCAAVEDPAFPGRGYAVFTLGHTLHECSIDDPRARDLIRRTTKDADIYVVTLAHSALVVLGEEQSACRR